MRVVDSTDDSPSPSAKIRNSIWSGRHSTTRELVLAELQSGRNPLETRRGPSFKGAAIHVQTAVGLRMSIARKRNQQIQESTSKET